MIRVAFVKDELVEFEAIGSDTVKFRLSNLVHVLGTT